MSGEIARLPDREPQSLLNLIARAMTDPNFDVQKLQTLLQVQRELIADQAMRSYNQDMATAQAEMGPVVRKATNTQTNSKYAKLETIDGLIRPIYAKYGFALSFGAAPAKHPGNIRVTCRVSHRDGHSEHHELEAPPDTTGTRGTQNKTQLHGMGSTISYLRRYLEMLIFNVILINEDNDGNRTDSIADGMGENTRRQREQAPPRPEPRQTGGLWLDKFEERCRECGTPTEAEAVLDDPQVQRMGRWFSGDAKARYDAIFAELSARFFVPGDDPPKDGNGNGDGEDDGSEAGEP